MEKQVENGNEWENISSQVETLLSEINSRNLEYSQRVSQLEKELERKTREIEAKNESLRKAYEELKENDSFKYENEELKKTIEKLNSKNREMESRVSEKDLNLATMSSALKDKNFELEKIWKNFEEMKSEVAQARDRLTKKDERIGELLKERENMELEISQLKSSLENIESGFTEKINILKRQLQEREESEKDKIFSLKEQVEENARLRTELEKKGASLSAIREELSGASEQISALKARLEETENNLKLTTLRNREPKIMELAESLNKKSELIAELESSLRTAESSIARLKNEKDELLKLNEINTSELKKLDTEIKKAAERISSLELALSEKENFISALMSEKKSLLKSLAEKEGEASEMSAEIMELKKSVSRLQAELRSAEDAISVSKSEKDEISRQKDAKIAESETLIAREKEKNSALSGELSAMEEKIMSQREEIKKLAAEAEMLKGAVRERENEIDILGGKIKALEEEVSSYKKISHEISASREDRMSYLNKELLAEKASYEARIAELLKAENEKYSNLMDNFKSLQVDLNEKEESIISLKKDVEILTREKANLLKRQEEFEKKYNDELANEITLSEENSKAIEEKEKYIKDLLVGINTLKNEIGSMKISYELLKQEKLEAEKGRVDKADTEKEMKVRKLQAEIKEKNKTVSEMEKKLIRVRKEKELLEEKNRFRSQSLAGRYTEMSLKRMESDLRAKNRKISELEAEYAKLEKSFSDFKGDISTKHNVLSVKDFWEIITGVFHQIANSISIIKSHAQLCVDAPGDFDRAESLSAILRSINSLQGKIEEISFFSRPVILQNKYIKLREALDTAVNNVKSRLPSRDISFEIHEEKNLKELKLDHIRFSNALEEVLLNAAEAIDDGGKIKIIIKKSAEKGSQLVIISDEGKGIEKNKIRDVFEPFFTTKHQKLGLGLSIAKNIIKAHGGDISLDSKPGKGTTVYIKMFEN